MKILLLVTIVFITAVSLPAQVEFQPAAFYVDYASFASDSSGCSLLEIYHQIYASKLSYILKDGKYYASYNVSAVVNKGKKQINAVETDGYLYADTYAETEDKNSFIINKFKFYLKPGKYKLQVTLNDLNASSSLPISTDIEVRRFDNDKPVFSDIEFARQVTLADELSAFNKINWRIIPACSRRYGDGLDRLKFYYELYNANEAYDTLQLFYEIIDRKNNIVVSDTVFKTGQLHNCFVDSINLENFIPGSYELVINMKTENHTKTIQVNGRFNLSWSALEMVKNDFKTAVDQLYYIANTSEMVKLRDTPEEQRIKEWNLFWKSKDPSPGTNENEIKDEYYRRLAYANRKYGIPIKEGWKTDMGMIHIINGEPDDIERHPFDIDNKPYEIWYFYSPRRRFLFIDTRGYGEYKLQYPYDGDVNKRINIYGGGP